jgi:hypothetical protein
MIGAGDVPARAGGEVFVGDAIAIGIAQTRGLGANLAGDMFCVDQQGTWIPTTPIYHLRKGAFFLNPEGIASEKLPESPLKLSAKIPEKRPYPEALKALPEMRPPAVWMPYNKVGRSGTDLVTCDAGGKFGPFDGQMFVAEFTDAKVSRVFMEKVDGEYQGACFPFVGGFASGIVRLSFAPDGSLMVGMTSRGWSSLGTKAYGLQRLRYNGTVPFAIKEMKAKPDGFELVFTKPVDVARAGGEVFVGDAIAIGIAQTRGLGALGDEEVLAGAQQAERLMQAGSEELVADFVRLGGEDPVKDPHLALADRKRELAVGGPVHAADLERETVAGLPIFGARIKRAARGQDVSDVIGRRGKRGGGKEGYGRGFHFQR